MTRVIKKKKIWPRLLIAVFVVAFAFGLLDNGLKQFDHLTGATTSSPHASATSNANNDAPVNIKHADNLVADLKAAIMTNPNPEVTAAVSMIDLSNGKAYNAGDYTDLYTGASTTKVLTAVDYLHQIELGKATLNQDIDGTPAQTLLTTMIENSDNDAWQSLELFLTAEQPYAQSIGMTSFSGIYDNQLTVTDEAKLLEELYQGKLLNTTDRAFLYNLMLNTTSHDIIPAALPSSATVYHKYGQLGGDLHDAAIIEYQGHKFVLVIYTNDATTGTTDDYDARLTLIHNIAQAAFNDAVR